MIEKFRIRLLKMNAERTNFYYTKECIITIIPADAITLSTPPLPKNPETLRKESIEEDFLEGDCPTAFALELMELLERFLLSRPLSKLKSHILIIDFLLNMHVYIYVCVCNI